MSFIELQVASGKQAVRLTRPRLVLPILAIWELDLCSDDWTTEISIEKKPSLPIIPTNMHHLIMC